MLFVLVTTCSRAMMKMYGICVVMAGAPRKEEKSKV